MLYFLCFLLLNFILFFVLMGSTFFIHFFHYFQNFICHFSLFLLSDWIFLSMRLIVSNIVLLFWSFFFWFFFLIIFWFFFGFTFNNILFRLLFFYHLARDFISIIKYHHYLFLERYNKITPFNRIFLNYTSYSCNFSISFLDDIG